jgi:hypothetical protein
MTIGILARATAANATTSATLALREELRIGLLLLWMKRPAPATIRRRAFFLFSSLSRVA